MGVAPGPQMASKSNYIILALKVVVFSAVKSNQLQYFVKSTSN